MTTTTTRRQGNGRVLILDENGRTLVTVDPDTADDITREEVNYTMTDTVTEVECLDDYGEGTCEGPVEFHTVGSSLRAFPRCTKHYGERLDRYENSLERYADSDVPPDWFDPAAAGERWDDDY